MSKPVVDGLERDLQGRATVLRIDITSGVGRDAARAFGVKAVPATLLFDGDGQLILRQSGKVKAGPIRDKVTELVGE